MAQDIADDLSFFFLTTLTSFWVCIIAAKLSVKLLCCLKDKKQCRDYLSRADCYDQSSWRHTINQPVELRRSPACFETTANRLLKPRFLYAGRYCTWILHQMCIYTNSMHIKRAQTIAHTAGILWDDTPTHLKDLNTNTNV